MNKTSSVPENTDNRVCSFCARAGGSCPYDLFHPPRFPCDEFEVILNTETVVTDTPGTAARSEAQRRYYWRNRDKIRKYYKKNRAARKAYQSMYRQLNQDAIRLKSREYYRNKRKPQ